jgi:2-haloacid dehalogenase
VPQCKRKGLGMRGYRSPSTARRLRAVLFDTFGTVVDWRAGIATAVAEFARRHRLAIDAGSFAAAWRGQYQPAMEPVRSGARPYVSLDAVLARSGFQPRDFPDDELDTLTKAWRRLPPWSDSIDGITMLKRHFIVGPLSNGNTALLVDMAKFSALPWDVVLGSDVSRAYKPDASAYLTPVGLLGLDPGEVMLVAAHNSDLAAAQQVGLATAFVARPLEHGPGQTVDLTPSGEWDVSGSSITELAAHIIAAGE